MTDRHDFQFPQVHWRAVKRERDCELLPLKPSLKPNQCNTSEPDFYVSPGECFLVTYNLKYVLENKPGLPVDFRKNSSGETVLILYVNNKERITKDHGFTQSSHQSCLGYFLSSICVCHKERKSSSPQQKVEMLRCQRNCKGKHQKETLFSI